MLLVAELYKLPLTFLQGPAFCPNDQIPCLYARLTSVSLNFCLDLEILLTCGILKWFFLTATLTLYAFKLNINGYKWLQLIRYKLEFQGCLFMYQAYLDCTGSAFIRSIKGPLNICAALQMNQPALYPFTGSFRRYFSKLRILALSRCHISH